MFDFSLSRTPAENYTAGTAAYLDPFIRDPGRRRWDDYAERFSCGLTLYQMATATLPSWSEGEGLPPLIEGELEIEAGVFDPSVREPMAAFFRKALARDVKQRFDTGEEMLRAWRQLFLEIGKATAHPEDRAPAQSFTAEEAGLDTQIGLLNLSPQALDTLGRLNINRVDELLRLPLNELVRMTGVGTNTRRELSELVQTLRARFEPRPEPGNALTLHPETVGNDSIDLLYRQISPERIQDPTRKCCIAL